MKSLCCKHSTFWLLLSSTGGCLNPTEEGPCSSQLQTQLTGEAFLLLALVKESRQKGLPVVLGRPAQRSASAWWGVPQSHTAPSPWLQEAAVFLYLEIIPLSLCKCMEPDKAQGVAGVVSSIWRAVCFEVGCCFKLCRVLLLRKSSSCQYRLILVQKFLLLPNLFSYLLVICNLFDD